MVRSVIAAAVRTPVGSFQGRLSTLKSTQLGSIVIREALKRANTHPGKVDEVIMGCALAAGLGQNPARQAAIGAGVPVDVGAVTVNKVCSSGLYAVMMADMLISSGRSEVVVAGGMESMSGAPYLLPEARGGLRLGDKRVVDSMIADGLWDVFTDQHMGCCAEFLAEKYGLTRQMQDAFAESSYRKALGAIESGAYKEEIVAVPIPQKRGEPMLFDTDEEPGRVKFEKIPTLKPAFKNEGTVTAANASSISDGAAALVIMSEKRAKKEGIKPWATIVSHATHSQEPEWFTTAPIGAARQALKEAGLDVGDIDLFEINEAFSGVTMAVVKALDIEEARVNVNGGAVAIGHPIGASGARILVTLLHALRRRGGRRGLTAICNGGGEATSLIVECS